MSLGNLIPLPADALVTPVTFRVRKRGLRGILAAYDAQEDGSRELSGEWVVSKKLWQRLQAEWKHGQSRDKDGEKSKEMGKEAPRKHYEERVILFLHGGRLTMFPCCDAPITHARSCWVTGAYYMFSPATHRRITVPLSKATGTRVFGE